MELKILYEIDLTEKVELKILYEIDFTEIIGGREVTNNNYCNIT